MKCLRTVDPGLNYVREQFFISTKGKLLTWLDPSISVQVFIQLR